MRHLLTLTGKLCLELEYIDEVKVVNKAPGCSVPSAARGPWILKSEKLSCCICTVSMSPVFVGCSIRSFFVAELSMPRK